MASELTRNSAPPLTFSLRTMFRIVTCAALASLVIATFHRVMGIGVAVPAATAFLFAWFAIKGWSVLTLVALVLIGFELLIPATELGHEAARDQQCANNLKQIGLALLSYDQAHGSLPPAFLANPAGSPLLSWRVLLLAQLDGQSVLDKFNRTQAWNGPNNAAVSNGLPFNLFRCPSGPDNPFTNYLAIVGPNTAWPGATGRKLSEIKNPSRTILVIEVADSGINWAEPRDLTIDQIARGINPKTGLGPSSHHPGGVNALFADGHVEFLPEDIDPKELARMCDINPPSK